MGGVAKTTAPRARFLRVPTYENVSHRGVALPLLEVTSVVLNHDGPVGLGLDKLLEVYDVAINVLKDSAINLGVVAGDECSALGHLLASAGASAGREFTWHNYSPLRAVNGRSITQG